MQWGIRICGSDDNLQLTVDPSLLFGVGGCQGERANTFAIESHVLGKGLGKGDMMALRNKMAHSECVTRCGTRGESLVSHIEEGEKLPLFNDIGDLCPLLLSRVNASWIVGTCVE